MKNGGLYCKYSKRSKAVFRKEDLLSYDIYFTVLEMIVIFDNSQLKVLML